MNRQPDDYDLERSYELERQLDRDFEREPYRARRPRKRPRYFSAFMFRPVVAGEKTAA